jgi:hypothetical protein
LQMRGDPGTQGPSTARDDSQCESSRFARDDKVLKYEQVSGTASPLTRTRAKNSAVPSYDAVPESKKEVRTTEVGDVYGHID